MIPGDEARAKFDDVSKKFSVGSPNFFGAVAAAAAFEYGEDWLKECYAYILGNYKYIEEFCASHWDGKVKPVKMEGTYLMWLDFNAIEKDPAKLEQVMLKKAKVALDEGMIFGKEGNGFERINLATPKSFIVELMDRIAKALKEEYGI
jgi:cystathionine beta-lyase